MGPWSVAASPPLHRRCVPPPWCGSPRRYPRRQWQHQTLVRRQHPGRTGPPRGQGLWKWRLAQGRRALWPRRRRWSPILWPMRPPRQHLNLPRPCAGGQKTCAVPPRMTVRRSVGGDASCRTSAGRPKLPTMGRRATTFASASSTRSAADASRGCSGGAPCIAWRFHRPTSRPPWVRRRVWRCPVPALEAGDQAGYGCRHLGSARVFSARPSRGDCGRWPWPGKALRRPGPARCLWTDRRPGCWPGRC